MFSFLTKIYSQNVFELYKPDYSKMLFDVMQKVSINTDASGRIIQIENQNDGYRISIDYEPEIKCKRIDLTDGTSDILNLGAFTYNLKDNSFIVEEKINGKNYKYTFDNGVLEYSDANSNEVLSFYLYRKINNEIESMYNHVTFGDVDCYNYDYKYDLKLIESLRLKDSKINQMNATILAYSDFESIMPLLLLETNYLSSPKLYKATSELKEKKAFYSAENLKTQDKLPWASANGYGIGDVITIETPTASSMNLYFYNGYQSKERPDLYKANSRAKKIRIENKASKSKIEIELKDTPDAQIISMKALNLWFNVYSTLEITILEVYPGEKYKDLCIQAIIPVY